jgi:hypothetical protein
MPRGMTAAVVVAAFITGAVAVPQGRTAASPPASETVTLDGRDRVRVYEAGTGCGAVRPRQDAGGVFLDCRKAGPLTGGPLADRDGETARDGRLLMQMGMLLGMVYVAFLTAWFWATRLRPGRTGRSSEGRVPWTGA